MTAARALTEVAVGVVFDAAGRVLVAQRLPGKPYEGWWEFPGGKFEPGEDASAALARELNEELGITVTASLPWVVREHRYPHADVRLHFRRVVGWQGEPRSREGQAFVWREPDAIDVGPLLPAALAPIAWLGLPRRLWISNATELGVAAFVARLQARVAALVADASATPARRPLLLLREPGMAAAAFGALLDASLAAITPFGADAPALRVVVSSRHPPDCWQRAGGVHLTGEDLGRLTERPALARVGASCHRREDLAAADRLQVDYAVYGPVLATASHPEGSPLGWPAFGAAIADTPVPVYALGGLDERHEADAIGQGAQGIALQRAAWA